MLSRPFRIRVPLARFKSDFKEFKEPKDKGDDADTHGKELSNEPTSFISSFKVKSAPSRSAPAPMAASPLMKPNNKPYVPRLRHERVSYEYPGLPNQDDFTQQKRTTSRWSRYVPKILTAAVAVWGAYTIKVWMWDSTEESGADAQNLLDPNAFHTFVVTHKEQVDADHFLVELHPRSTFWQYAYYNSYAEKSIWNGDRLWSVEVKQPEIMVVRSYTPLPLYFMKSEHTRSGEKKPLLRVVHDQNDYDKNGVICLYVKRYDDGEVSRYITSRNVGDELQLRGPHVEYTFPYHPLKKFHERPIFRDLPSRVEPENLLQRVRAANNIPPFDNLVFYAGGTGIAPALQLLLSRNPYRGFVTLHYSAHSDSEIQSLDRFLFFLEKLDRLKVVRHIGKDKLKQKDVCKAAAPNYLSPMRKEQSAYSKRLAMLEEEQTSSVVSEYERFETALEQAKKTSAEEKSPPALAIVCGPDGFVDAVAGPKDRVRDEQGRVGGMMEGRGWDGSNVFKL